MSINILPQFEKFYLRQFLQLKLLSSGNKKNKKNKANR